jgi:hypothetical protein
LKVAAARLSSPSTSESSVMKKEKVVFVTPGERRCGSEECSRCLRQQSRRELAQLTWPAGTAAGAGYGDIGCDTVFIHGIAGRGETQRPGELALS